MNKAIQKKDDLILVDYLNVGNLHYICEILPICQLVIDSTTVTRFNVYSNGFKCIRINSRQFKTGDIF